MNLVMQFEFIYGQIALVSLFSKQYDVCPFVVQPVKCGSNFLRGCKDMYIIELKNFIHEAFQQLQFKLNNAF